MAAEVDAGRAGMNEHCGQPELCPATARKPPDFPEMSISEKLGKHPLRPGRREAKEIQRDAAVAREERRGRSALIII